MQIELYIWVGRPPTGLRYLSSKCYRAPTYGAESPCPSSTNKRKVGHRAHMSRAVEFAAVHVWLEFTGQADAVPPP